MRHFEVLSSLLLARTKLKSIAVGFASHTRSSFNIYFFEFQKAKQKIFAFYFFCFSLRIFHFFFSFHKASQTFNLRHMQALCKSSFFRTSGNFWEDFEHLLASATSARLAWMRNKEVGQGIGDLEYKKKLASRVNRLLRLYLRHMCTKTSRKKLEHAKRDKLVNFLSLAWIVGNYIPLVRKKMLSTHPPSTENISRIGSKREIVNAWIEASATVQKIRKKSIDARVAHMILDRLPLAENIF